MKPPGATVYHVQEDIIAFFFSSRGFAAETVKAIMRVKVGTNRSEGGIIAKVRHIRRKMVDQGYRDPWYQPTREWDLDTVDAWIVNTRVPRFDILELVTIDTYTAAAIELVSDGISLEDSLVQYLVQAVDGSEGCYKGLCSFWPIRTLSWASRTLEKASRITTVSNGQSEGVIRLGYQHEDVRKGNLRTSIFDRMTSKSV